MFFPPAFEGWFKRNSPEYKDGFKDGFNCAKTELLDEIKSLQRKAKSMQPFQTSSSTVEFKP